MSESPIELRGVRFAYGDTPVLRGIDLAVGAGEIYGLVGPDGAGKSTLLRLGTGQLAAASGTLRVLGRAATDPALRDAIAYMPQGFGLYADLGVQENLAFFADLHGLDRAAARRRIADLLRRTGLAGFEARRAAQLSGGMQQKLALACALVSEPRAMFLDEPTTGVDPLSRRAFWRLLLDVRAAGVAILYATANLDEAERCDRVGLLQEGRLLRQGAPQALAEVRDSALFAISGSGAVRRHRDAIATLPGVERVFAVGAQLHAWVARAACAGFAGRLTAIDPGLEPRARRPSLNDALLHHLAARDGGAAG